MAKDYAVSFYESKQWKQCRESYLISQDYICERCMSPAKIVHHKTYINPININDPNITLSWDNLEALCQDCHNREHMMDSVVRDDVVFNSNGELIQRETPHKERV